MSYFLASVGACNLILHIHVVIDSCPNRVSSDQYHMIILKAQVSTIQVIKFSVDKFLVFNWLLAVDFFAVFTSLLFEVIINLLIGALPLALAKYVKIPILGKLVDKLLTFDKGQILHGLKLIVSAVFFHNVSATLMAWSHFCCVYQLFLEGQAIEYLFTKYIKHFENELSLLLSSS